MKAMLLEALQELNVPSLISRSIRSPEGAKAGLLYRAGEWDQAHQVVQSLDTAEGSFWHGILHRQEKDWSNAAYWFRRVGPHPVYEAIQTDAMEILKGLTWHLSSEWDPIEFIQWAKQADLDPGQQAVLTKLQVSEWHRLFDWCNSQI